MEMSGTPEGTLQQRLNFFQPKVTKEQHQEKLINYSDKLRTDKRKSLIARKRLMGAVQQNGAPAAQSNTLVDGKGDTSNILSILSKLQGPQTDSMGHKGNLQLLKDLRIQLLQQEESVYHHFIQEGGIQLLTRFLQDDSVNQQTQLEAVWAINNLSLYSGIFEKEFSQAAEILIGILRNDQITNLGALLVLKEQCIQALGNFCIDSATLRQQAVSMNGIKLLVDLVYLNRPTLIETALWALNNMMLGDQTLYFAMIEAGISRAMVHIFDKVKTKSPELLQEQMWLLYYLINANEQSAQAVFLQIPNLLTRLSSELDSDKLNNINRPILKTIGNLIQIDVTLGQSLMYDDKFQTFIVQTLFNKESNHFKKESLWILSNILAGPSEHNFEFLTENRSLLEQLCSLMQDQDYQIRKEAMVAIYNLSENHSNKYLPKVMQFNPLQSCTEVLNNYFNCDPYMLKVTISFCCLVCEKYGQEAIQFLVNSGATEMIENIQYKCSENVELFQMSSSFMETFVYQNDFDGDQIHTSEQVMAASTQFNI